MISNENYYLIIAKKFMDSNCTDSGFELNRKFSLRFFNDDDIRIISYCYLIQFLVFLYNYEKVNNYNKKNFYLSLNIDQLNNFIYKFKTLKSFDYKESNWNKLRFYKNIKDIIFEYSKLLFESDSILKFNTLDEILEFYVNSYNNFVDNGSYKTLDVYPLFDDIVGLFEAKQLVYDKVINPILYKNIYEKYNVSFGGGVLLYGLPGTGKTMFAQALANELDAHFISIKSSDLKSKWYGETESNIKEIFNEARLHDVSVIFFDEFESIGVSRDKLGAELTASTIVPELLAQIQGFEKNNKTILIVAATNRPWDIDSALLRPGRFDSLVYIELPNYDLRLQMISKNLKGINIEEDLIDYLASSTKNFNGADIKKICDILTKIVINNEINGIFDYEITFEDCVNVLKENNSSVANNDVIRMNEFYKNKL